MHRDEAAEAATAAVLVDAYSARMEAMKELIKGLVPEADMTSLESLYRVGKSSAFPYHQKARTDWKRHLLRIRAYRVLRRHHQQATQIKRRFQSRPDWKALARPQDLDLS
jgi:hypothetical protein